VFNFIRNIKLGLRVQLSGRELAYHVGSPGLDPQHWKKRRGEERRRDCKTILQSGYTIFAFLLYISECI
jgi:hypothetical protein